MPACDTKEQTLAEPTIHLLSMLCQSACVWTAHAADGDSASTAKARRKLAAAMCKRLQELLTCLRVLVGTVIAMPVIIDQQVHGT
jgi:hypothetical protein